MGDINSFRDIENFLFRYEYPILPFVSFATDSKYNLLSDRNKVSNNRIQRISQQGGISDTTNKIVDYRILYGIQDNTQADLKSIGHLLNSELKLKEIEINNYKLNSSFLMEYLKLKDGRKTSDVDVYAGVGNRFSQNEELIVGVRYKKQDRNFIQSITPVLSSSIDDYLVESNTEHRISTNFSGK